MQDALTLGTGSMFLGYQQAWEFEVRMGMMGYITASERPDTVYFDLHTANLNCNLLANQHGRRNVRGRMDHRVGDEDGRMNEKKGDVAAETEADKPYTSFWV